MIPLEKEHVEYSGDCRARLIIRGQWIYGEITPMLVQIFAINYDYYYEINKADGFLDKEDKPKLNELGEQYFIAWHENDFFSWSGTIDYGGISLEEAKQGAQMLVQDRIKWDAPITLNYL
ncbi:MAG: hypothetical protein ACTHMC_24885 [Pseudobacter sp.]|uniref:hypothetical protein n=1 Tax=Pseudobacter sp. TaxID=2045420 RepID=UPI003F820959